jgi:hypothetical protein
MGSPARGVAILAAGLALAAGCDGDCEEPDQHGVGGGWLVMDDVARTPDGLEDVPGLLAISTSGDMQLGFSRGAPTEIDDTRSSRCWTTG